MIDKKKVGLFLILAVAMGFARVAVCGTGVSQDVEAAPTSKTRLAQAGEAGAPSPATETKANSPCDVPKEYVRLINAGDYGKIGALFSDDAIYMGPDGKTRHGGKAVGAFYSKFMSTMRPHVAEDSFLEDGNICIMELGATTSPGSGLKTYPLGSLPHPTAIDLFTVNAEGKASKFLVYVRPGTQAKAQAALAKVH